LIGKLIWPYQILSILGNGGMGVVYLAFDQQLQRKVALKFLHDHLLSDSQKAERFKQEARAASALNHPNILTIHQVGELDGRQFIATEFVEGETLRQLIDRKELNLTKALEIAVQVCSALMAAHDADIVHRDIKPENVMIRPDGYVKLLDFGIAKLTEESSPEAEGATLINTEAGTILGTVKYMSPEQVRGLEVDARTDVWGVGVLLYEMLTGSIPFQGETRSDTVAAILQQEPPFSQTNLPAKLSWVLTRALAKDREERYQTIKELRSDLESLDKNEFQAGAETSTISTASGLNLPETVVTTGRKRLSRIINSLAILPFVNESDDADAEYLSDGITESIINNLSQLPKLKVLARSTVFRYKGPEIDAQRVGQQLGVRAVVTGRVRQAGDVLMIGAELIDIGKEAQLWGEHYRRKMSDIFDVQEEIAHEICAKLKIKLSGDDRRRLRRRHTEKSHAYELYLKGRYFWDKRVIDGFEKAIDYFHRAIEEDPAYALAYVGLSDCYQLLSGYGASSPQENISKARAAANKALVIDPTLAEAHASLGHIAMFHDWAWINAENEFKSALKLNPNYATAHHWYSICLRIMGRTDEALAHAKEALELDRSSLIIQTNLAILFYLIRRYDEAIEQYENVIDMDENFSVGHMIGLPFEQKQRYEEAIASFRKALKNTQGDPEVLACIGHVYAVSGRAAEARGVLTELNRLNEKRYVQSYGVAVIHAGLGEIDEAFELLEKGLERRDKSMSLIRHDPRLDALRSDARFQNLLERMGLEANS
jgi:serine/threonine protein kinase/Flp pilus assembly protein TadD